MVKKSYKPQAIITGAGSGIGRATAKRFYEAGYSVCCIDINQEELKKTLASVDSIYTKMQNATYFIYWKINSTNS